MNGHTLQPSVQLLCCVNAADGLHGAQQAAYLNAYWANTEQNTAANLQPVSDHFALLATLCHDSHTGLPFLGLLSACSLFKLCSAHLLPCISSAVIHPYTSYSWLQLHVLTCSWKHTSVQNYAAHLAEVQFEGALSVSTNHI